jgi:hypothetical protein
MRLFGHQAILHDKEGAGDGAGDDKNKPEKKGDPNHQGHGGEEGGEPPKHYTQADVDALLAQKLRGQGSAIKEKDAELERLRAKEAKRHEAEEKRKQAAMSDLEKAQARADAAEAAKVEAETKAAEVTIQARADKAKAEVDLIVKGHDPIDDDVYSYIPAEAMATGDDGLRTDDAKAFLEKWIEKKTGLLLKGSTGTGPAAGAGGSKNKKKHTGANADVITWKHNRNRS